MWQVKLNQESRNYLVDSAPYVMDLLKELTRLESSDNGHPAVGMVDDLGEGVFLWGMVGHLVLYRRIEGKRIIRILLIKPFS